MKPLTVELLAAQMEDHDWAALFGAISCALYNVGDAPDSSLDRKALTEVLRRLPQRLQKDAFHHGFEEPAVADGIIQFVQHRLEELGSLDALLRTTQD